MEQQATEHELEVAAARHDQLISDTDWQSWDDFVAGQLDAYEDTDPQTWPDWADQFRYVPSTSQGNQL
jgi:hypothetical protein